MLKVALLVGIAHFVAIVLALVTLGLFVLVSSDQTKMRGLYTSLQLLVCTLVF
jgi:flagellar biosynthesis/type III secretory pathway M-ring protein FliF/YscJ